MSLLVFAYERDASGNLRELPPREEHHQLAGFESYRRDLFGSDVARALGLTLLITLPESDIYADGPDLDVFEREVRTLLANVHLFGPGHEYFTKKLANVLHAVALARTVPGARGGVYLG